MRVVFDHEGLEVYQVARQLNRELRAIADELPRGSAESADNLLRAGKSITRNIAEGCARGTADDRAHHFRISRGSGTEVGASLDELVDYRLATEERVQKAKHLAWRVVSMLVNLIRAIPDDATIRAIDAKGSRNDVHVHVARTRARHSPEPGPD